MRPSRGMGVISPSKVSKVRTVKKRDGDEPVSLYAKGGPVSKVNEAGNYTKPGMRSTQGSKATGERYLPEAAIKALSPQEYSATTRAKREGRAAGKQFVAQPKSVAKKTAAYRK